MKLLRNGAIALMFVGVMLVPNAHAQAATIDEMVAQIQTLITQIQALQAQLNTIRGEVKAVLKDGLKEGMTDEDIKKIQEVLATDSTIYPEGLTTGYFGPLTKNALKRFQARHELEVTGEMSSTTREWFEAYLDEAYGGKIPPGLLRAPGILKKVELRYANGCEKRGKGGMGPLCKKLKVKYHDDDDDSDDDSATTTTNYRVVIDIEGSTTTVSFKVGTTTHTIMVRSTSANTVLAAVAGELNVDVSNLSTELVNQIRIALTKAKAKDVIDQAMKSAQSALDDAEDAIQDAGDAIASSTNSTTTATALLEDAVAKFDVAQVAFDAKNYATAKLRAEEAEELAKDAEDAV